MMKSLQYAEHKPKIAANEFFSGSLIAAMHEGKEFSHALIGENREGGRVYTADFNLAKRHDEYLLLRR